MTAAEIKYSATVIFHIRLEQATRRGILSE